MFRLIVSFCLLLGLAACEQDAQFKIRYDDTGGLAVGDPVVVDEEIIGRVKKIKASDEGGFLVSILMDSGNARDIPHDSSFVLESDPRKPERKRIEIELGDPAGPPIADGAIVQGAYPSLVPRFPLGALLKGFTDAMRDFRGQVEGFKQELEKAPRSNEAKELEAEWRKLQEELDQAGNAAEDAMKRELLPKLKEEMESLRKRLEALPKTSPHKERARAL
jgi:hypothetical protein